MMSAEFEAILARTEQAAKELDIEIARLKAAAHMLKLQEKLMEDIK